MNKIQVDWDKWNKNESKPSIFWGIASLVVICFTIFYLILHL